MHLLLVLGPLNRLLYSAVDGGTTTLEWGWIWNWVAPFCYGGIGAASHWDRRVADALLIDASWGSGVENRNSTFEVIVQCQLSLRSLDLESLDPLGQVVLLDTICFHFRHTLSQFLVHSTLLLDHALQLFDLVHQLLVLFFLYNSRSVITLACLGHIYESVADFGFQDWLTSLKRFSLLVLRRSTTLHRFNHLHLFLLNDLDVRILYGSMVRWSDNWVPELFRLFHLHTLIKRLSVGHGQGLYYRETRIISCFR